MIEYTRIKMTRWNGEVIITLCCIEMLFLQITCFVGDPCCGWMVVQA